MQDYRLIENISLLLKERYLYDLNDYVEKEKNDQIDMHIYKGIFLGDKSNIKLKTKNMFKSVNFYHTLAVSGMHISYIMIILNVMLKKVNNILLKTFLLFFTLVVFLNIVGVTASLFRAISFVFIPVVFNRYNKDIGKINLIFLSFFLTILIYPYKVLDVGLYLSYIAVLAIYHSLTVEKNLKLYERVGLLLGIDKTKGWVKRDRYLDFEITPLNIDEKYVKEHKIKNRFLKRIYKYIFYSLFISFSVYLFILPVYIILFKEMHLNFFLANLLLPPIVLCVCIMGCMSLIVFILKNLLLKILVFISFKSALFYPINLCISIVYDLFNKISYKLYLYIAKTIKLFMLILEKIHNFSFGDITVSDSNIYIIYAIIYYSLIYILLKYFSVNKSEYLSIKVQFKIFVLSIKKKIYFFRYTIKHIFESKQLKETNKKSNKRKTKHPTKNRILMILIILIFTINTIYLINRDVKNKTDKIMFLDVGQGDSSYLYIDRLNILVDAGYKDEYYDNGVKIRKRIRDESGNNRIDYLFISHFDIDHIGGVFYLIDNMKINKIYIPRLYKRRNKR